MKNGSHKNVAYKVKCCLFQVITENKVSITYTFSHLIRELFGNELMILVTGSLNPGILEFSILKLKYIITIEESANINKSLMTVTTIDKDNIQLISLKMSCFTVV